MLIIRRISLVCCAVALVALLSSSIALAGPVTVKLRVEGSSKTLFEGNVTTGAESIETPSGRGSHPCDYAENGSGGGYENGGNDSGTPTTALHDAALASGLPFDAKWYGSGKEEDENPGDFFITQVGEDTNQPSSPYASWGYAVNDTTAPVGGCQIALAPGSEVLWAYNYDNLKHLLSLSSSATASVGVPFTVHVVDGQTGEPISGAEVGQTVAGVTGTGPTTEANGNATVTVSQAGSVTLKATRGDSVRSNGAVICVHNGEDGTCGTGLHAAPGTTKLPESLPLILPVNIAEIPGIVSGHAYARRSAPRLLQGKVAVPADGSLRDVRVSLTRRYRGRCFAFNGAREKFVRAHCGASSFFSVGDALSFSYLLPARLQAGRYVYEIEALNDAGTPTKLVDGVSHVVFRVK
jgi:hypothetical protein